MDLLPNVGLIAVLWYGGQQVIDGSLSLGDLVTFNAYIGLLIWPLRMLGMIIAQAHAERPPPEAGLAEVLSTATEVSDPDGGGWTGAEDSPEPAGTVEFRDLVFGYDGQSGEAVLERFSLRMEPGESVALVGSTGSGKSTVARLIPRYYDADSGSVRLERGVDVR